MKDRIRFHLDENISQAIANGLRRRGIDVTTTPQESLIGKSDEEQLAFAVSQKRVIFTQDTDFLRLHQQSVSHYGIVYCQQRSKSIGGLEQGIHWWGFEGNEAQRIEILRSTDAFILPSLVEGLSLSLLEAMACGTACLATDAGADGEVLAEGAGIILHPQRVVSELQTLLPLFVEHPEFAGLLGLKARQRVLERYTLRSNIDRLELLYQELLHPFKVLSFEF